jgi:hypothetical protein
VSDLLAIIAAENPGSSSSAMHVCGHSHIGSRCASRRLLRSSSSTHDESGARVAGDRLAQLSAVAQRLVTTRQQLRRTLPALFQRLRAHVLPVHLHLQKTRSTPIVDSETAPVVLERRPRPMKPEASLQQESVRVSRRESRGGLLICLLRDTAAGVLGR